MAYKTLRRIALKDQRIIKAKYHNNNWYCTDALATVTDIFSDYKPTKSNTVMTGQAILDNIIDKTDVDYMPIWRKSTYRDGKYTQLQSHGVKTSVNTSYLEFLLAIYPNATVSIAVLSPYKTNTEPVRLTIDNKIVAVLMPIKE